MQAFVNLVLTLCDSGDSVVMFAPYYFNAYMSFQMTGVTNILVGPGHPETLYPDAGEKLNELLIAEGHKRMTTFLHLHRMIFLLFLSGYKYKHAVLERV